MSSAGVQSVEDYTASVRKLLARAQEVKPEGGVDPALTTQDFGVDLDTVINQPLGPLNRNYAAIETACRNIFYDLLSSTSIGEAAFGEIWNLFDVLSILSDLGKSCDFLLKDRETDCLQKNANQAFFSGL